ncbi:SusC/RagA family TonB-linked outer membrane protein [Marinoscillum sp.]|uniref:SusC/RagA family TonB-linked outer membrane protein n=1 Tax=Marinoscillum sp. TaxID=2024838 RepID=UPI003BAC2874
MKKNNWRTNHIKSLQTSLFVVLMMISSVLSAQERVITGKVTDAEDGSGIPGANVIVKGTSDGTTTDFDGNYRLSVSDDAVLVFSFIGYKSVEEPVGNRSTIDVDLSLDIEELQEVVVVGYGAVQKKDVTGVVAKVDKENFNNGAITSPTELLAGKVAGVSITTAGGIGGAPQVRIRGTSSINASSDPLYVIDGVIIDNGGTAGQRNPLNFINTEDIESITVLKDASAAAIYGSRGAKGVIIINTKQATGDPRISYDGYYSVSNFIGEPQIMSANQFTSLINSKYPQYSENLGNTTTDWVDEVTQTATGMKHALSLSNNGLYISMMHHTLNGVVRKDKIERNIFNLNYNNKFFNDVVKLNIALKNGFTKNNFGSNQVGAAYDFNPTVPVRSDSSIFGGYYEPRGIGELGVQNPVAQQNLSTNIGRSYRGLGKVEVVVNIPGVEGLSVTNNISYDVTTSKNRFFQPLNLFGVYGRGSLTYDEALKTSLLFESFANYKTDLGSQNNLELTAGYSTQTFNFESTAFFADSLKNDLYTYYDISQAKEIKSGQGYSETRQESVFGRINYSFQNKYLVTANFRVDGSSQFGQDNRYAFFPSLALGWRVIDESFGAFLEGPFDDFKLRAGYGKLGNQEFGSYLYETFYYPGTNDARYQFGNQYVTTLRPTAVDPGIKWELTETYNIGLDYTISGGRFYGSLEVYQRNTDDLLFRTVIPAGINVGDRVLTNVGSMVNKGVEFELSAVAVDKPKFKWNLSFNASHNQNEVTRITGGSDQSGFIQDGGISGDVGQTIQIIAVGQSLKTFHVLEQKYENGKPVNDQGLNSRLDMYVDQNDDGIINENDLVPYKNANPDFEFGFTSNATAGNFNLSFTLRSKVGNYVYNNVASSKGYFNRIKEFGPNNIHTSAFKTLFEDKQLQSSYYVENASFLKLDNITLSYNIDALEWAKIRLYGTAQNVLTVTGYSGLDPEVAGGIDNGLYPRSLNLIGGINITF